MRQFVLRENIVRFQRALEVERHEELRLSLREMLASSRRELALLEAELLGAQVAPVQPCADHAWRGHVLAASFRDDFDNSAHPCMVLDPRPGLTIVDLNAAHLTATNTGRDAIGRRLFDAFPDNPADPGADGVHTFYTVLRAAAESGLPQSMPAHRCDVRGPDGRFVERHWRSETTPLSNENGRLLFLLHKREDVTAEVAVRQAAD